MSILPLFTASVAVTALSAVCTVFAGKKANETDIFAPIADHHLHLRSPAGASFLFGDDTGPTRAPDDPNYQATTAKQVLAALDAASIEHGLVLSIAYMFGSAQTEITNEYSLVKAENNYIAEQVATAPERLIGACSVNPLRPYARSEIKRCADDPRLRALKLHLTNSRIDLRNTEHVQVLAGVFNLLQDLNMPVVVHMRTGNPNYGAEDARIFIREVMSQAPGLPIHIAHMAGWGGYDASTDSALESFALALSKGTIDPELISFGLGAVVFQPTAAGDDRALELKVRQANVQLAARIREIGPERVLFATDWPSWPPTRDMRLKINQNASLLRQELPLSTEELNIIFSNRISLFRH